MAIEGRDLAAVEILTGSRRQIATAALACLNRGIVPRPVDIDDETGWSPGSCALECPTPTDVIATVPPLLWEQDTRLWLGEVTTFNAVDRDDLARRMGRLVHQHCRGPEESARARSMLSLVAPELFASQHLMMIELLTVMLDTLDVPDPSVKARQISDYCHGLLVTSSTLRADEDLQEARIVAGIRTLMR